MQLVIKLHFVERRFDIVMYSNCWRQSVSSFGSKSATVCWHMKRFWTRKMPLTEHIGNTTVLIKQ